MDNGPELRGRAMETWSETNRVALLFIEPGKPVPNAFIEASMDWTLSLPLFFLGPYLTVSDVDNRHEILR